MNFEEYGRREGGCWEGGRRRGRREARKKEREGRDDQGQERRLSIGTRSERAKCEGLGVILTGEREEKHEKICWRRSWVGGRRSQGSSRREEEEVEIGELRLSSVLVAAGLVRPVETTFTRRGPEEGLASPLSHNMLEKLTSGFINLHLALESFEARGRENPPPALLRSFQL